MIRFADNRDIFLLKRLWITVFKDSESFVDFFFEKRYHDSLCLVDEEQNNIRAMLYLFPCQLKKEGKNEYLFYVYAVATLPEYRNLGIMGKLIDKAYFYALSINYIGLILIPATIELFKLYSHYGFKRYSDIEVLTLNRCMEENIDTVSCQQIDSESYLHLRNEVLGEGDILCGKSDIIYYLNSMYSYHNAQLYLFSKDDAFAIAMLFWNKGYCLVREVLYQNFSQKNIIQYIMKNISSNRFKFYFKVYKNNLGIVRNFTMIKTYLDIEVETPYFNLGMD